MPRANDLLEAHAINAQERLDHLPVSVVDTCFIVCIALVVPERNRTRVVGIVVKGQGGYLFVSELYNLSFLNVFLLCGLINAIKVVDRVFSTLLIFIFFDNFFEGVISVF